MLGMKLFFHFKEGVLLIHKIIYEVVYMKNINIAFCATNQTFNHSEPPTFNIQSIFFSLVCAVCAYWECWQKRLISHSSFYSIFIYDIVFLSSFTCQSMIFFIYFFHDKKIPTTKKTDVNWPILV